MNFNKVCYFTQHIQNIIISTCNQHNINELFYIFFHMKSQNLVCILYLQHISVQSSHISNVQSHMWLMVAMLDSAG